MKEGTELAIVWCGILRKLNVFIFNVNFANEILAVRRCSSI